MVAIIFNALFLLVSSLAGLYLFLFIISSLKEKATRAALISTLLLFLQIAITLLVFSLENSLVAAIIAVIYCGSAAVMFWPARQQLDLGSPTGRYDERDIMFARARYVPTSREYDDYYSRHPERKSIDDEIRSLPELLLPGGTYYHPIKSAIAETLFELNEKLFPLVDGPVADEQAGTDPAELSGQLKSMARHLGAVDAGIAKLDPNIVYSHVGRGPGGYGAEIKLNHSSIIVFAVEMGYSAMQHAPRAEVVVESARQYLEAAKIGIALADFIRSLGFEARAHMDANYRVILPPAAVAAGLGEMGRLGIFMNRLFGPRVRLGAVTTTAPLSHDTPRSFGGYEFCLECKKCAVNCPAGAISHGEPKIVKGVKKWSTNQQACYRYWREVGTDCGICMSVCPFSKPNNGAHNLVRMAIKNSSIARRFAAAADDLFYSRFPLKKNQA